MVPFACTFFPPLRRCGLRAAWWVLFTLSGTGLFAQITQSGRAVLRVPVAGRELRSALHRVERLFADNRLEEGYSALRRLFVEGEEYLFPVSPDRYVAGDLRARSFLLSLTDRQRAACRRYVAPFARECETRWREEGDRRAFAMLHRELLVTAPGKKALARHAEELFEKALFSGAADAWNLLFKLGVEPRNELLQKRALASFLAGNRSAYGEALAQLDAAGSNDALTESLRRWAGRYNDAQDASVSMNPPLHSVFDVSDRALPRAPFQDNCSIVWRTVGGLWPQQSNQFLPTREQGVLQFAVPFKDRVYATSGHVSITEFDGDTGKMLYRFHCDADPTLRFLDQYVERNPRTTVVTDDYVIAPLTVRVKEPSQYRSYAITEPIPFRAVFVFSRTGRGLLWRSDGIKGLEDLHVVGVPLLRGDVLYIPGWKQKGFVTIYVAAVNVHTGELLWRNVLCGSQVQGTMFGEMAVEPFGVTLAASRELLFAASHMGAVAALRRTDGKLRWLTTYESRPVTMGRQFLLTLERSGWYDNPLLLHEAKIIACPRDCPPSAQQVLVLDAASGRTIFSRSITERLFPARCLLGIHEGRIYVAGDYGVQSFSLHDTSLRNVFLVQRSYEKIIGRPALTAQGIYYCTMKLRNTNGETGLFFHSFSNGKSVPVLGASAAYARGGDDASFGVLEVGNVSVTDQGVFISSPFFITHCGEVEKRVP